MSSRSTRQLSSTSPHLWRTFGAAWGHDLIQKITDTRPQKAVDFECDMWGRGTAESRAPADANHGPVGLPARESLPERVGETPKRRTPRISCHILGQARLRDGHGREALMPLAWRFAQWCSTTPSFGS